MPTTITDEQRERGIAAARRHLTRLLAEHDELDAAGDTAGARDAMEIAERKAAWIDAQEARR